MAHYELVECRIAVRLRIGRFDDGRARIRTVSIRGVRHDVTVDEVWAFVQRLAPLLAYPVEEVRVIKKERLVSDAAQQERPIKSNVNEAGDVLKEKLGTEASGNLFLIIVIYFVPHSSFSTFSQNSSCALVL